MNGGEYFTPQMFLEYLKREGGFTDEDLAVDQLVVLAFSVRMVEALLDRIQTWVRAEWIYEEMLPLYRASYADKPISIFRAPIGAAATVAIMEEMITCGGKVFLGLGAAGSLSEHIPAGSLVVPTGAIREEGTSFHYLPPQVEPKPSERLALLLERTSKELGTTIHSGRIWTTDAPYRELKSKVEKYSVEGTIAVDMETSAMYALGQSRGVEVANLLVVSDELLSSWRPAFLSPAFTEGINVAAKILLHTLERL